MKKTKIGIPRALLYHRYGILWKTFFTKLGCKIILSPETTEEILMMGTSNTVNELCLPYKIYIGHILYLNDICDYILIAHICNYGKDSMVCPNYSGIYNTIKHLIPKEKIILYSIEHTKFKYEFTEFIRLGLRINKNIFKIIYSYFVAKKHQKKYDLNKESENKNKLYKKQKKLLVVSQSYSILDKYVGKRIVNYLEKQNVILLYANYLDKTIATSFTDYFSDTLSWTYSKELIGAIYYYRYQIDGLIFITVNNCQQDIIVNNLAIMKNRYLPILNLKINDQINNQEIENKIQNYLNTLNGESNE